MAVKYKLVFSDFDDTLTRSDGSISERTVRAIAEYEKAGGKFVVCTGRSYASIKKQLPRVYGERAARVPVICFQGGLTADENGNVIRRVAMDKGDLAELAAEAEAREIVAQTYSGDRMYCSRMTVESREYEIITDCTFDLVGDLVGFIKRYDGDFDKLLMIAEPDRVQTLKRDFEKRGYASTRFVFSRPKYLEAIPVSSGKDKAIQYFIERFGYRKEDAAAFGDSNNDTDMLKAAYFGVAMGNAREECKLAADYVTDTNDNDGLAKMLESFILA